MTDELKPCPDCGVRPEMSEHYYVGSKDKYWRVKCPNCGNFIAEKTLEQAIYQWNLDAAYQGILPCPFCGHEGHVKLLNDKNDTINFPVYAVCCKGCGAEVYRGGSKTNAINAWNTRQNWTSELPSHERFVNFLKEARQMLLAMEVNSDETGQIIDEFLDGLGVKEQNDKG